jgi:hypothetical protein
MGKRYEQPFRQLVADLDPTTVLAYVDPGEVDPKYREHIARTFADLEVKMVATLEEANFIVSGYVTRDSDEAIGLAISCDALGDLALFPDGYELRVGIAA